MDSAASSPESLVCQYADCPATLRHIHESQYGAIVYSPGAPYPSWRETMRSINWNARRLTRDLK